MARGAGCANRARPDLWEAGESNLPRLPDGGWSKLSRAKSIPTAVLYLLVVNKTPPFHCPMNSLDCYPAMETEFVSTGQKPAKTTSWNSAKSALISANNPKIQQKAFNFQQSLGTKAVAAVQSGAEVPGNFA